MNKKALDKDIDLNADDVGAVGKTGAQTMAGQLNGVKFTVTDAYGLVSKMRPQHGLYLGNNANDKRTIIGGGGDAVGDATGAVHIRPNGITDMDGEVIIHPTGTIEAQVEPTAIKHLANKGYVDKVKTAIEKLLANYLHLDGGTMKGKIIAATVKAAIHFKDKASLSFQDAGGSVLHAFASGNSLRFAHGNNGENRMLDISQASIESAVPIYANAGLVAQSPDKAKWMSMEVPTSGNPFIASRATGEAAATQAMVFGKDNISCMKKVISNAAQIRNDAGLEFSPNDDRSGTTWGIGINPNDRTFSVHKYVNAAWNALPFWIDEAGVVGMNTLKVKGGADVEYMQVRNSGNPSVELHDPGNTAAMMYKPDGTATLRFCQSNGAGGEARGYAEISESGVKGFARFTAEWSNNRSWHSFDHVSYWAGHRDAGEGALFGMMGQRYTNQAGGYDVEMFHGFQTTNDVNGIQHVFACQGEGYLKVWTMNN
ncbi:MAG: hypothetical protein ACRCUF_01485, partial [Aeromonas sobria]